MKCFEYNSDPQEMKQIFVELEEALQREKLGREAEFKLNATLSCLIRRAYRAGKSFKPNIPSKNRSIGDFMIMFTSEYNCPHIKRAILEFSRGKTIGQLVEYLLIEYPETHIRFNFSGRDDVPLRIEIEGAN